MVESTQLINKDKTIQDEIHEDSACKEDTQTKIETIQLLSKLAYLEEENSKYRYANEQLINENTKLQNSLKQRDLFVKQPSNSNINNSFPTTHEILANYVEVVEQDVVNYVSDFSRTDGKEETLKFMHKLIQFILSVCHGDYWTTIDKIWQMLAFNSRELFLGSKVYLEIMQHYKQTYKRAAVLTDFIKNQIVNAVEAKKEKEKEKKKEEEEEEEKEKEAAVELATKLLHVLWEFQLSGLKWVEKCDRSCCCRTIGKSDGKTIIFLGAIASGNEIVKHGYIFTA